MGTFAKFYGNMSVPEERIPELTQRMMRLLEQGGIMQQTQVLIYQKRLLLLRPIKPDHEGKVFF